MDTDIFGFQPKCLWQLFKEGWCQDMLADFVTASFETLSPPKNTQTRFFDIFSAQNDCIAIGSLMNTEISRCWTILTLFYL